MIFKEIQNQMDYSQESMPEGESQLAYLEHLDASAGHLVELLNQAKERTLKPEEQDELLSHPNLSPEMIALIIHWSCCHFENGKKEIGNILERGEWDTFEQLYIINGYDRPYAGGIRQNGQPWMNWAEKAEGLFLLEFNPSLRNWSDSLGTEADRKTGYEIIRNRILRARMLRDIIRAHPQIALMYSERIKASGEPYAVDELLG